MATLFSGGLDIGNVALRPSRGQPTEGARATAVGIIRYLVYRKARGNSPEIRNQATTPSYSNY